jgi:hydrogenase large subunit
LSKISLSPVTRVSGLLSIDLFLDSTGIVAEANCIGEQFRGFETMLKGRHVTDAVYFTQRVCGICSMAHGYIAARLVGKIYGLSLTPNIERLQQAMLGAEFLQNHIRHFYLLVLADYLDSETAAQSLIPFTKESSGTSRFSKAQQENLIGHYFASMEFSRKCHEMLAVFGGKIPHQHGLVAQGVTVPITSDRRIQFISLLAQVQQFIDQIMLPDCRLLGEVYHDYFEIGSRPTRYISFGLFNPKLGGHFPAGIYNEREFLPVVIEEVRESIRFAWYQQTDNQIKPDPYKPGAYTWVKAPRYNGMALEGGPLARKVIKDNIHLGNKNGVMARLLARTEEASLIAGWMRDWINELPDGGDLIVPIEEPVLTKAIEIHDAPRGTLLHAVGTEGNQIAGYDIITPTTWNFSPKDDEGQRGPVEEALVGTLIESDNTAAPGRIIRSFDPCLTCGAHVIDKSGNTQRQIKVNI